MAAMIEDDRGFLRPILQALTLAYISAASVFLWSAGPEFGSALHTYHPFLSWSLHDIATARVNALIDAEMPLTAIAYDYLSYFSLIFVLGAVIAGLVSPFVGKRQEVSDPVVLMLMSVTSLFLFAAFTNGPWFADLLWQSRAVPFNLANLPLFWFATLIAMSIVVARTLAAIAHDSIVVFVLPRVPIAEGLARRR